MLFAKEVLPQEVCDVSSVKGNVHVVKAYAGMGERMFELLNTQKRMVSNWRQAGNLPPETLPAQKCRQRIPVVLVSRCSNGKFMMQLVKWKMKKLGGHTIGFM